MKIITMMELRAKPGEYIFWRVGHDNETIYLTHGPRAIAKIVPLTKEEVCRVISEQKLSKQKK